MGIILTLTLDAEPKPSLYCVRSQVLMAANMLTVFWDIVPCSLVEVYRSSRGADCLATAMMMEAVSIPETPDDFYRTTRHSIPKEQSYSLCCITLPPIATRGSQTLVKESSKQTFGADKCSLRAYVFISCVISYLGLVLTNSLYQKLQR
jgi:hypothetical protein